MGRHLRKVLAIALIFLFLTSYSAALGGTAKKASSNRLAGQVSYEIKETAEKWSMTDGIKLPVSVFTPRTKNTKERFPVIVFIHGWGGDKSMAADDAKKYAGMGYVTVTYTVRGWFGAQGTIGIMDPDYDGKDLSRIITLVSKGTRFPVLKDHKGPVVGVTGYSLGGLVSYMIAPRKNPRTGDPGDPRVRAVVPMHGGVDLLYSLMPNQAVKFMYVVMLMSGASFGNMFAVMLNALNIIFDPNMSTNEKLVSTMNLVLRFLQKPLNSTPPEFAKIFNIATQRRLEEAGWCYLYFKKRSPRWWCDQEMDGTVEHPINVPTLITTSWNDDLFVPNEHLAAFNSMIAAPKKIIIGSGGHGSGYAMVIPGIKPRPNPEADFIQKETEEWFDHFLKGIKNGVEKEPAVSYYRSWDPKNFGTSEVWPLAGTKDATYYLIGNSESRQGTLSASAVTDNPPDVLENTGFGGTISIPYFTDMLKVFFGDQVPNFPDNFELLNIPLTHYSYVTAPFEKELQIDGTPRLTFSYKSTNRFTQLTPRLYEVAPDGKQTLICRGWYEGQDKRVNTRVNSGDKPIDMVACCYKMKAGSRLKLEIRTSDFLMSWPVWTKSTINIFHDGPDASRLILPVAPQ